MGRKFEVVRRLDNSEITMPKRSTQGSAGYDFYAIKDQEIPPMFIPPRVPEGYKSLEVLRNQIPPVLVFTGIKAKMNPEEVLLLFNRSSNPIKKNLVCANSVGVIDSDYYGNEDNDGEIAFEFYNFGDETVTIHKGDKIGQGVFVQYLTTEDDTTTEVRSGGLGSTGK